MQTLDELFAAQDDPRRYSPAAQRNREPIASRLAEVLPASGTVLEIASGSGEHAMHFAEQMPALTWQPSDASDEALRSITAWRERAARDNLLAPIRLDVTQAWPAIDNLVAISCLNMLHIAPWAVTQALMDRAAEALPDAGILVIYGPFKRQGKHTADSNARFDADLRQRDPTWGVRDLEAVERLAQEAGFSLTSLYAMPANNFCVAWSLRKPR